MCHNVALNLPPAYALSEIYADREKETTFYLAGDPGQAHEEDNAENVLQSGDEHALHHAEFFARAFLERKTRRNFAQLGIQLCVMFF